jgi:hypothetical protein
VRLHRAAVAGDVARRTLARLALATPLRTILAWRRGHAVLETLVLVVEAALRSLLPPSPHEQEAADAADQRNAADACSHRDKCGAAQRPTATATTADVRYQRGVA